MKPTPTPEMIEAANESEASWKSIWPAMLAAAPLPPFATQPASTALVERLGLAWAAVGHHEGIEISVHADAADTWNALCAILDPLARSALSASTSREGER